MKIEGKYRPLSWVLYLVVVLVVLYLLGNIINISLPNTHTKPQWYMVNLETDTCVNSRAEASSIGVPQMATPYRFNTFMENRHSDTYAGTKTYHFRDGGGEVIELMNDQGDAEAVYFAKKRGCEKGLRIIEGGN